MPVAVVVNPTASGTVADHVLRESRSLCHIGERAVPVVVIEHVVAVIRNEQIVKAVVIVIADGNTGCPTRARQSGFRCRVSESAVSIVLVQAVRDARRITLQACTVENEQIHPAIVVVIDEGDASPNYLDDVTLGIETTVHSRFGQARLFRGISEMSVKGSSRRLAARLRLHSTGRDTLPQGVFDRQDKAATSNRCRVEDQFPARDHWVGSTALRYCRALTFSNFCRIPDGQRISISLAVLSFPSPAITRLSLAERYPTAVFTVKYWVSPEADTILIRAPIPSRFDFVPTV